jgi:hypothetical protein
MALWFFKTDVNSSENSQLLTEKHISLTTIKSLRVGIVRLAEKVTYFLEVSARMESLILVGCNHGLVKEA